MFWFGRRRDEPEPEPELAPEQINPETPDFLKTLARGQTDALGEIWRRHYRRMLVMARHYLDPHPELRQLLEADDVLGEAAARLTLEALAGGLIDKFSCRNDFWLYFRKVLRQCVREERERNARLKRGGEGMEHATGAADQWPVCRTHLRSGTVVIDDLDLIAARKPGHEIYVQTEDVIRRLYDLLNEEQKLVASLRASNYSVHEIAEKMRASERTVARRLEEIREIWDRSGLVER